MAKILLADDDKLIASQAAHWLRSVEGHIVEVVSDGNEAIDRLRLYDYDAAVLDWSMPGATGLEVCKTLRASGSSLPVLFLTAKSGISDKVAGLNVGADDYLTKPFDLLELSARLRALLRRANTAVEEVYHVGDLQVDTARRRVLVAGEEVVLTATEFSLLELLVKADGRPLQAEEIVNKVWSSESDVTPSAVKTFISRIRAKLGHDAESSLIQSIHGMGYCIRAPREQKKGTGA